MHFIVRIILFHIMSADDKLCQFHFLPFVSSVIQSVSCCLLDEDKIPNLALCCTTDIFNTGTDTLHLCVMCICFYLEG